MLFKMVIVATAKTVEGKSDCNQKICVKFALFHIGNNCSFTA